MKSIFPSFSIFIIILVINQSLAAQEIWGMTKYGGKYNKGVIFKMDEGAINQEVVFSFETMGLPEGKMTEYSEGIFYGMTSKGLNHDYGIIYKYESATSGFTNVFSFDGEANGKDGAGGMVHASNGRFYGMTVSGGAFDKGIIFEFDPESEGFNKKIDFNGSEKGSEPLGSLIEGADGLLYGMTSTGGEYDSGTLFVYDYYTNNFEKIFDFRGKETGTNPMGTLTEASDGLLYGMTRWGGENDYGVIFRFVPKTREFNVIFEFDGVNTGRNPQGSLLEASNGKFYGTTSFGGAENMGVLFEFDYSLDLYLKRFEFSELFYLKTSGSLVEGPDRKIYGAVHNGYNDSSLLLECDLVNETINIIRGDINGMRDFYGSMESLTLASNGKLFFWGRDEFYIDKEIFLVEFDFESEQITNYITNVSCNTGSYPHGELVQAANGNLYGLGSRGGKFDSGVLFEFNPESNNFKKLIDLEPTQQGASPRGSLIPDDDSILYGMTGKGGVHDKGVLFRYNPDSTKYTKLLDFNGMENGANPYGSLVKGTNGLFYGMTAFGGFYDLGILFEFEPETGILKKLVDFDGTEKGSHPYGSLIQASNGKLYGVTQFGGTSDRGTFFEFDYETGSFLKLTDTESRPVELMQASNNHIYISSYAGVNVFNPEDQSYERMEVSSAVGFLGKLFEYVPNKLLGMDFGEIAYHTGIENRGMVFELDLEQGISSVKVAFDGPNGRHPDNSGFIRTGKQSGPVAQCKPHTLYLDEEGGAVLHPEDVDNGSAGDGIELTLDKINFTCEDLGENHVTLTVTDANSISSTCSAVVHVVDTIPPDVACQNIEVFLDAEGQVTIDAADIDAGSYDACGIALMVVDKSSFGCEDIGENLVKLSVTDNNGNSSDCQAIITVHDPVAPEISCRPDITRYLEPYEEFSILEEIDWKAIANDNCGLDSVWHAFSGEKPEETTTLGELILKAGQYEIEWTVADNAANTSYCTHKVSIDKRPTTLFISENNLDADQGIIFFEAVLMDDLIMEGIKDKLISVSLDNNTEIYKTDEKGVIKVEFPLDDGKGSITKVTAQFGGDNTYMECNSEAELLTAMKFESLIDIQVYPNPFTHKLNIEFVSPVSAEARIDLYDSAGRLIKTILKQQVIAGNFYKAEYIPGVETGGIFLYQMTIGRFKHIGKVMYQR